MQISVKVFVLFWFLDAVSKTAAISFVYLNVTQKKYQNIQLDLLQLHTKFHPDQLKSVQENEAKRFALTL